MGNNYTVTMPSDELHPIDEQDTLEWHDFHAIRFAFDSPFALKLADGEVFHAEQVVRVIPKKRLVAFGTWKGKPVVAKLFYDRKSAKRHLEKDATGVKTLQDYKIPTPALCYEGLSADKRIRVLILERIFEASSLEEVWRNRDNEEALLPMMQAVVIELATQHVLGVLQHDMHLKNFMITDKHIYTLDGGQVELFPHLLTKKQSINNLALFLSQLGVGVLAFQDKLFHHYAKSRGWRLKKDDVAELFFAIKKWNDQRWQKYEKKIFRDSSSFCCIQHWRSFGMFDRDYAGPEFMHFMDDPEFVFTHPSAVILKAGRSATVIKVNLDHRELVVKRYNMKNVLHRLRRCLRPTRASKSWRLAQKLNLFGINTAKPVGFIERRMLGFRGQSYYVTEYVAGEHAGEYLTRHQTDEKKITQMTKRMTELLKNLAKLEITHGDLKVTNILINSHEHPTLIDLDGAAEHVSLSSLRSAWRKEIKRFLENFKELPAISAKFKELLAKK